MDKDASHVERLWSLAMDMLPEWTLNGAADARYHGTLNVRREGVNGLRLMSDAREVPFSLGSAFGSGSGKVSHVLREMGDRQRTRLNSRYYCASRMTSSAC